MADKFQMLEFQKLCSETIVAAYKQNFDMDNLKHLSQGVLVGIADASATRHYCSNCGCRSCAQYWQKLARIDAPLKRARLEYKFE